MWKSSLSEISVAENIWFYTQRKKMIYCIFVLEGLKEFSRDVLWFYTEKPALPILN